MKKGYELRSDIVHGQKVESRIEVGNEDISFAELVDRIEDRLRGTIRYYLSNSAKNPGARDSVLG